MKKLFYTLPVLLFSLPALAELAPLKDRRVEYVEQTGVVKKEMAYKNTLSFLSKIFNNANAAIKLRDDKNSQIIAKGILPCNATRPGYMFIDFDLYFNFDFQAKDGRVRIVFEDLTMKLADGSYTYAGQIEGKEDVDSVKAECLDQFRSHIVDAIKNTKVEKDW
jgi:hypothetical protein